MIAAMPAKAGLARRSRNRMLFNSPPSFRTVHEWSDAL
jgi:hypothetical protein